MTKKSFLMIFVEAQKMGKNCQIIQLSFFNIWTLNTKKIFQLNHSPNPWSDPEKKFQWEKSLLTNFYFEGRENIFLADPGFFFNKF